MLFVMLENMNTVELVLQMKLGFLNGELLFMSIILKVLLFLVLQRQLGLSEWNLVSDYPADLCTLYFVAF